MISRAKSRSDGSSNKLSGAFTLSKERENENSTVVDYVDVSHHRAVDGPACAVSMNVVLRDEIVRGTVLSHPTQRERIIILNERCAQHTQQQSVHAMPSVHAVVS